MTDETYLTGVTVGMSDKKTVILSVLGDHPTVSISLPKNYAKQLAIRMLMVVQEIEDNEQLSDKESENE